MLCKHEVVGSIPIGSTNSEYAVQNAGIGRDDFSTETNIFECGRGIVLIPVFRILFSELDIVKAGLAGLHNRLIQYDTQD